MKKGIVAFFLCFAAAALITAQNDTLQRAVAELKQSLAANQKALAQYTWIMKTTMSLKDEEKSVKVEQVRIGPDGQLEKTLISNTPPPKKKPGLRGKIIAKKTEEIKDYTESMMKLAMGYAKPLPEAIQAAKEAGKVRIGPGAQANILAVELKDLLKPGDMLTISFDKEAKAIRQIAATSFVTEPPDVMTLSMDFQSLPDGTNYLANMTVNGKAKEVTINIEDSNYIKMAK